MHQATANEAVEARLRSYHEMTRRALLRSVPVREPRRYLYDLVAEYPDRGGQRASVRRCASATCRAFGGSVESVLSSAVAIELFHNAFLVHDDVEDGSEDRRGSPTLHAEHGVPIAVNVGDAMNVLSIRPLMENLSALGPDVDLARVRGDRAHGAASRSRARRWSSGWVRDNALDLDDDDYLRMTLKKTCWYTCIHPCRIGALIAHGSDIDLDRFDRFGFFMGAAFQIQDDLLNLVGDAARYGKEIGGDIWEGKRTLMLIHVLNSASDEEHRRMKRFLEKPRANRSATDIRWIYRMMSKYGSVDYGRERAWELAEGAQAEFETAYAGAPPGDDRAFIEQIVFYMVQRDV